MCPCGPSSSLGYQVPGKAPLIMSSGVLGRLQCQTPWFQVLRREGPHLIKSSHKGTRVPVPCLGWGHKSVETGKGRVSKRWKRAALELLRDASSPGAALLVMYHCPDVTWKGPRTSISWKILGYLEAWGAGLLHLFSKGSE